MHRIEKNILHHAKQRKEQRKLFTKDLLNAQFNLDPVHCYYCDSTEITFLQYIGDAHCSNCGRWQNDN